MIPVVLRIELHMPERVIRMKLRFRHGPNISRWTRERSRHELLCGYGWRCLDDDIQRCDRIRKIDTDEVQLRIDFFGTKSCPRWVQDVPNEINKLFSRQSFGHFRSQATVKFISVSRHVRS